MSTMTEHHPENLCQRCGGRNLLSWFADSDKWNAYSGDFGVLCPICFAELAEAGGFNPTAWRLAPSDDSDEKGSLLQRLREALDAARESNREVDRMRDAVLKWSSAKADDRCIEDDDRLLEAFGLPVPDRHVGDKFKMLANCARFIDRRCLGGKWPSYVELEAEVERLRKIVPENVASSIIHNMDTTQMWYDPSKPWENPNTLYVPSAGFLWQRIVDVLSGKPRKDWRLGR